MEDAHIGEYCSICHNKDYLPITCAFCNLIFCKDHIQDHGCTFVAQEVASNPIPPCFFCDARSIATCETCGSLYCVQHRYHSWQQAEEAKIRVEGKPLNSKSVAIPVKTVPKIEAKKERNKALAAKVERMRVKGRATGDTGISTKYRFALRFESEGHDPVEIFIASYSPLGIMLDTVKKRMSIANRVSVWFEDVELDINRKLEDQPNLESGDSVIIKEETIQRPDLCPEVEEKKIEQEESPVVQVQAPKVVEVVDKNKAKEERKRALAAKVERMKVKGRAKGDDMIPTKDRFALRFECTGYTPVELYVGAGQPLGFMVDIVTGRMRISQPASVWYNGVQLPLNKSMAEQEGIEPGDCVILKIE